MLNFDFSLLFFLFVVGNLLKIHFGAACNALKNR